MPAASINGKPFTSKAYSRFISELPKSRVVHGWIYQKSKVKLFGVYAYFKCCKAKPCTLSKNKVVGKKKNGKKVCAVV